MAIGDRITSARTTSIMRRINALEDSFSYAGTSQLVSSINVDDMVSGHDGFLYVLTTLPEVRKYNDTTGALDSTIISNGSADGSVSKLYGSPDISYSNGKIFITDTADQSGITYYRVQRFDTSGNCDWTYKLSTTGTQQFLQVSGMTDGSCFVTERDSGTNYILVHINASGTSHTDIFSYDPTSSTVGDIIFTRCDCEFRNNQCAVAVDKEGAAWGECRIYSTDHTLVETYTPTSYTSSKGDSFTNAKLRFSSGHVYSDIFYGNPTSDLAYEGIHFPDNGGPSGDAPWRAASPISQVYTIDEDDNIFTVGGGGIRRTPKTADTQTTFYKYGRRGFNTPKTSLGTPDYGDTIPATSALTGEIVHHDVLDDMKTAVENIAVDYINPATSAQYTLTAGVNNIYRIAIDSGQDDWTTDPTSDDRVLEEFYDELELVLDQLEISELA